MRTYKSAYQQVDSGADATQDLEMVSPMHQQSPHVASERGFSGSSKLLDHSYRITDKRDSSKYLAYGVAVLSVVLLLIFSIMAYGTAGGDIAASQRSSSAAFDALGRYIMSDFDEAKPMSDFLCGIGGVWGVPMWAFFVNRGQGVTSFGIQNKDGAIAKFNTAEKAYQQTPFTGFRTLVKGVRPGGSSFSSMPFFPKMRSQREGVARDMMIGSNEMEIQEVDDVNKLQTNVLYYTMTNEDFPALVRKTTFTNLDNSEVTLEVLDGLGRLVPSGLGNWALDAMGRTMEAWMNVYNSKGPVISEPFFHISQGTADSAQVQIIKDGHFAVAFIDTDASTEAAASAGDLLTSLPFIVDPSVVFDTDTTMIDPRGFFDSGASVYSLLRSTQGTTSRTPCAFAGAQLKLAPGKSATIVSVYGHADNLEQFVNVYSPKLRSKGFVSKKRSEAQELTDAITEKVVTKTSSPIFDAYVKQDFLDNVLRGGFPMSLGKASKPKIYHTYSRIHGDIERDYNNFQIDTSYFSQGPGNFRDVNQNRRLDVFHTPSVGDFNVRMFLSFVQSDGYNPLTVATTNFKLPSSQIDSVTKEMGVVEDNKVTNQAALVKALLAKPFRVGQLFNDFKAVGVKFSKSKQEILDVIMDSAEQTAAAQYAQNGFWADHWTYTLDLLDNYVSVFPDKEAEVLWDSDPIPFYMSPAVVKPRHTRYSLVANPVNPSTSTIRVYNAVAAWGDKDFPEARKTALNAIYSDSSYVADQAGAGGAWQRTKAGYVFAVPVVTKLAMLGLLKFSTLDPEGMGVEMEGGKPGWNDAMNGLPGLLGSGMPETYEMIRILRCVDRALQQYGRSVSFPIEFGNFLDAVSAALDAYLESNKSSSSSFLYWDTTNKAREIYREATIANFDGTLRTYSAVELQDLLAKIEKKNVEAVAKALATNSGLSPTYFYYECTGYEIIPPVPNSDPTLPAPATQVLSKGFSTRQLPLFLEGPTRHLKVIADVEERREVYRRTKASNLYDEALQMFTISESLATMGQDVGRMMAFSAGWLENQSVWLHMSYKFYLELLRGGLYEEFFNEIQTGLVPFMDSAVYGRSPLQAASFIVSSAFPDPKIHGSSFLARLSGSTAEFLSMWALMMAGHEPFVVDASGELGLSLRPLLPGWLFTEDGSIASFTFLGATVVTYHNPKRIDTWKANPSRASVTFNDGTTVEDDDAVFGSAVALRVRNLEAKSIDVYF